MINVLICDDCSKTVELIKNIVTEFCTEFNFKAFNILTFNNSTSILSYIKTKRTKKNIYILDIDLNEEKNGLLLGRDIRKLDNYSGEMIYITNHSEMCFKVFQYKLRILEFIDKTYTLSNQLKETLLIATRILNKSKEEFKEQNFKIKSGLEIFNIPIKDIVYFESIKGSKKIQLSTAKNRIQFYGTLKELKDSLDSNFIQIHKSTIINKNFIVRVNKAPGNLYVKLKTGIHCPLSRTGLKEVNKIWTC